MARRKDVPEAPEDAKHPLLYKPRAWANIRVGANNDARWRCVSQRVDIIDRAQVHRLQLRAAHEEQARKLAERQKAKSGKQSQHL